MSPRIRINDRIELPDDGSSGLNVTERFTPTERLFEEYFKAHCPKVVTRSFRCEFLVDLFHCAGGNYCHFPPGQMRLCCSFCPRVSDCPDEEGICTRLLEKKGEDDMDNSEEDK